MRTYQALNPIDQIEAPPDTVQTLLIAGSSGQASDWFVSSGAAPSAAVAGAQLARFTGVTTLSTPSQPMLLMVNLVSTHAAAPASGTSVTTGTTAGSTGNNVPVIGTRTLQIPTWSTGFSVASLSSGYVMVEVWRK